MKIKFLFFIFLLFQIVTTSCKSNEDEKDIEYGSLQLISIGVGTKTLSLTLPNNGCQADQPVVFRFSQVLDTATVKENILLSDHLGNRISVSYSYLDSYMTVSIRPSASLSLNAQYITEVKGGIKGANGERFPGLEVHFTTLNPSLVIDNILIDGEKINLNSRIMNVSLTPVFTLAFSKPVNETYVRQYTSLTYGSQEYDFVITQTADSILIFNIIDKLPYYRKLTFKISAGLSELIDRDFVGLNLEFYTGLDETDKFPLLTDEELLTLVQKQTFRYFWDFGHPVSGLSRERNTSDHTVTSGGSGFGMMVVIVGIERGFITREEGIIRLNKMIDFLGHADRFHGAWSHWLNGVTGKAVPFSANDDGGDLVETSYLAMGLLTVRQYLDINNQVEKLLADKINILWESIEWNWYTQGQNSLTWHWSPNFGWVKNHKIRGWNEALITYIMAASSPAHSISKEVYEQGWGAGGNMINGKSFYGIKLPLGTDFGGPLFFEHYTYLGVDPHNLTDQYANYWEQAVHHTLINRQHCINNPKNYVAYSAQIWGLTASDGNLGYSAHSPTNDRGVISPTAALSSIPFTPEETMVAMRHFYYKLGDRLWGPYGFYDAFNVTTGWFGTTNIAIDQGPIIIMIENYRTGLLWNLFMSAPEIKQGMIKLGFSSPRLSGRK